MDTDSKKTKNSTVRFPAPRAVSALRGDLLSLLGANMAEKIQESHGELTCTVEVDDYLLVCKNLRDHPLFRFSICIDLCGVDYLSYGKVGTPSVDEKQVQFPYRFAAVLHLLSLEHNQRLRLRVFCDNDNFPSLPSVSQLWSSTAWYEREAFDLFGIIFSGHSDLRRILTDYGFIGYPFRKDFPISGHVEMRYDPEQKRVIYQPVSIAQREITPRVIREPQYAHLSPNPAGTTSKG